MPQVPDSPHCQDLPEPFRGFCNYDLNATGQPAFALSARNASKACNLQACGCGDDASCRDCAGVPYGTAQVLACGCGDDTSCRDCAGVPYGVDLSCVDCSGVRHGSNWSCLDCSGVKYGRSFLADGKCTPAGAVPAGKYVPISRGAVPTSCPAGAYCSGGAAPPIACEEGFFCPAGASQPTACPAGAYCPAGATAPIHCKACREGHYRGRCGRSKLYPNGPCWKCPPCSSGHVRVGCGGASPGTCVRAEA